MVSGRRKAATSSSQFNVDSTQLEFSESMRRTQQAVTGGGGTWWWTRWCGCQTAADQSQDKYAVDVLATEIDSLKRTVTEVPVSLLFTLCTVNGSSKKTHLRATKRHLPYGITQCHLPPDIGVRVSNQPNPTQTLSLYKADIPVSVPEICGANCHQFLNYLS